MKISQEKLNQLAFDSAKFVAEKLSSYIKNIRKEEKDDYIDIYLDNPSQIDNPLWISTEDQEITVSFGEMHYHLSTYNNEKEEDLIEEMLIGIMKIISGVEKSYSAWDKERCLGGGVLKSKPCYDDLKEDNIFKNANFFKIVAWNVNDNEEIKNT